MRSLALWLVPPLMSTALVFWSLGSTGAAVQTAVPADLKIVARYGAGGGDSKSWRYTITGDGKVAQQVFGFTDTGYRETKKNSRVSEDALRVILAKIKDADYFALKERYDHDVTDQPTLILSVTLDKATHEVRVYAPDALKENKEVKRFLKVWSEVLKKVPSPNPWQTPEHDDPT